MAKRNYIITGITRELAEKLDRKEFRNYLRLFIDRRTKAIQGKLSLNWFDAIKVRISIINYNRTHPCVLKLHKCKKRSKKI